MAKGESRCALPFEAKLLHPRYWLSWLGVLLVFFLSLLPTNSRHALGAKLGELYYQRNKKRRHIVDANLAECFPELSAEERQAMVRKNFRAAGMAYADYSIFFFARKRRLARLVEVEGLEHIEKAKADNKNIMVLLGHSLLLEFAAVGICEHFDCCGSYNAVSNDVLNWLIARGRCRYGKAIVARDEGLRRLVREMRKGRLIFFLPDEDYGIDYSLFAPFFAATKATLNTPPRLSKLAKAVALPTMAFFDVERGKYRVIILPPLADYPDKDAYLDAVKLNQALETLIQRYPEQYMWTLKLFKTRPEGKAALY